jgi:DNA modification methylase
MTAAKAKTRAKRPEIKTPTRARTRGPAKSVVFRPISELAPYARNARTHSDAQVAQIAASMQRFGYTNPVLADDEGIVAGHGRVLGAERLYAAGRTLKLPGGADIPAGMVPTIDCNGWSKAERRAYILADNQLALNAGWDMDLLKGELSDLMADNFDVSVIGFSDAELDAILAPAGTHGLTDPDAAPPLPTRAVSVAGDCWLLGTHRLLCGDATVPKDVGRVLDGVRPTLMATDPPYGVNYDPAWREEAGVGSKGSAKGKVMNDDRADWRAAWALFPGAVAYVWHGGLHAGVVDQSLRAAGFEVRSQIIWVKTRPVLSRGNYHWQHEPAFYAVKGKDDAWQGRFEQEHDVAAYAVRRDSTAKWQGGRKQSTVWFIEHLKNDTGHGTQKPVECMRRPIENNTAPGQAVYEPFSGSGTTIIAAEMTGRQCFAIELDPAYVDVAVERWQAFTGKAAVLDRDGRSFLDVKVERHG